MLGWPVELKNYSTDNLTDTVLSVSGESALSLLKRAISQQAEVRSLYGNKFHAHRWDSGRYFYFYRFYNNKFGYRLFIMLIV